LPFVVIVVAFVSLVNNFLTLSVDAFSTIFNRTGGSCADSTDYKITSLIYPGQIMRSNVAGNFSPAWGFSLLILVVASLPGDELQSIQSYPENPIFRNRHRGQGYTFHKLCRTGVKSALDS